MCKTNGTSWAEGCTELRTKLYRFHVVGYLNKLSKHRQSMKSDRSSVSKDAVRGKKKKTPLVHPNLFREHHVNQYQRQYSLKTVFIKMCLKRSNILHRWSMARDIKSAFHIIRVRVDKFFKYVIRDMMWRRELYCFLVRIHLEIVSPRDSTGARSSQTLSVDVFPAIRLAGRTSQVK